MLNMLDLVCNAEERMMSFNVSVLLSVTRDSEKSTN